MTGVSFRAQSINWIDPAGAPGWQPASYQRDRDQENRRAKHGWCAVELHAGVPGGQDVRNTQRPNQSDRGAKD
jgi:hypothetical protein